MFEFWEELVSKCNKCLYYTVYRVFLFYLNIVIAGNIFQSFMKWTLTMLL